MALFYTFTVPFFFLFPYLIMHYKLRIPVFQNYIVQIFLVILAEICIWAVYRNLTAPYFAGFGTMWFYLAHIVAAPIIHLVPIIIFWKHFRKERGLPFKFSTKLLMSGLIIGFIGAIIWRISEQFIYTGTAGLAGANVANSFTFYNLLETPSMFALMTFVMFFVVGPVEELEFRSFTQDQASRALSNKQAVIFSSILFGCSHIPIALFVYRLYDPSWWGFVGALYSWIAAGVTFAVLYMYSRNIWACVVMHGMGNWQLSVFYFTSDQNFASPFSGAMVEIVTSTLANGLMIFFFYYINKNYWQPHRRGEPAFNGAFMRLQEFVFNHDFGKKHWTETLRVCTIFCVMVCALLMVAAIGAGVIYEEDTSDGDSDSVIDLSGYEESSETLSGGGTLDEGQSEMVPVTSENGSYIKSVTVTLTWTDEPDERIFIRTYENQPDTFSVTVSGPNGSLVTQEDSNPPGGQGTITATLSFEREEIEMILMNDTTPYDLSVEITLVSAGNKETIGLIALTDNSNEYSYSIDVVSLSSGEAAEETGFIGSFMDFLDRLFP